MAKKLFDWEEMDGKLYSNGWRAGVQTSDVIEPATGKKIARVGLGSAQIIAEAAKTAAAAQKEWMLVPPESKRALLLRADAVLHESSNVPLLLAARVIAPALATGNAVLVKPHPSSNVCGGFVFARIFEEAGLPPGLLHVIPAKGKDSEAIETDPNISMIHFTGSSATGQRIAEVASRSLKKVSISGSGKNPLIVLDDVEDMDAVISTAVYSTFYFGGQSCMTAGRHLIHSSLVDEYIQRFVEAASELIVDNPLTNPDAFYGPMIQPESVKRQEEIVEDAVAKGAKLHLGGKSDGPFFHPTVLSGIKPGMQAWEQEIFGPIAAITAFDTDEQAIQMANDTPYGLSGAVLGSPARATRVAEQLQTGMIHINDRSTDDSAYVPFGGVKLSGNGGRYGSYVNWDEYTQWRWFTVSDHPTRIPLSH